MKVLSKAETHTEELSLYPNCGRFEYQINSDGSKDKINKWERRKVLPYSRMPAND